MTHVYILVREWSPAGLQEILSVYGDEKLARQAIALQAPPSSQCTHKILCRRIVSE